MLVKIPLLSFLIFGVTYPLCFWLTRQDPIKNNFQRFHLACPVIVGGLAIVGLVWIPMAVALKCAAFVWLGMSLALTAAYWNKERVNVWWVSLLAVLGIFLFMNIYAYVVAPSVLQSLVYVLSGLVVSSIFYAMNLGHFYLNVHGLKVDHLKTAVRMLLTLLAIRLAWDISYMMSSQVTYVGEPVSFFHFLASSEGILLLVGILFGTLFPLIGLYFAFGTLKLKNTQATTGILYVLLSSILLGEVAYKYYQLSYGIPM